LFYAIEFSAYYQIQGEFGVEVAHPTVGSKSSNGISPLEGENASVQGETNQALKEALRMNYRKCWLVIAAGLLALGPFLSAKNPSEAKTEQDRLQNAGTVMQEILKVPDDIPQDLIDKARCVVVMPSVLKAAFVVGGSYGRGTMVCRTGKDFSGSWGAPAMYALEGGSIGLQIGGEATDFVFLVLNDRGASSLLRTKVKLGADASIAAGPKGRSAAADTDAYMRAEILSYSRARGVFAGISLDGSTLRPDEDANRKLYGKSTSAAKIILESDVTAPDAARDLISALQNSSPQLKR
jgi:lipid-binding SYLF domain-containing protein